MDTGGDQRPIAGDLAKFLRQLWACPPDGPPPGEHNFFRGGPFEVYGNESFELIEKLADTIDGKAAESRIRRGLEVPWSRPPVWVHGDLSPNNLLVEDGRIRAVLDFGGCAVGDPACDLTIAWTLLGPGARRAFHDAIEVDPATWRRGKSWALWKAMFTLWDLRFSNPAEASEALRTVESVLSVED